MKEKRGGESERYALRNHESRGERREGKRGRKREEEPEVYSEGVKMRKRERKRGRKRESGAKEREKKTKKEGERAKGKL